MPRLRARLLAPIAGLALAVACGARTELGGTKLGFDASAPCPSTTPPWIVFDFADESGISIHAMHADGSAFHKLDLGVAFAFHPSISPDGRTLLFVSVIDDKTEDLVRYDLESKHATTVKHATLQENSGDGSLNKGAISPDNTLIAYEMVPDMHVMSFDGSNDRVLVAGPYEAGCCGWSYGYPMFLPDSRTIYFATVGRMESIQADGTGRQLLEQDQFLSNPLVDVIVFPNPSLSPDATQLVAQVGCDVSELRVFTLGSLPGDPCATGKKVVQVHTSQAINEASNASWGASGIVYDDAKDLFLVDPNGGAPTNLTSSLTTGAAFSASDPVWASGCVALP